MYEKAHQIPTIQTNKIIILRSIADDMWDIFDFSDHLAVQGRFHFPAPTCPSILTLDNTHTTGTENFEAGIDIISTDIISGNASVHYEAGNSIQLDSGFEIEAGAELEITIGNCAN